jgi:hypothetical protein
MMIVKKYFLLVTMVGLLLLAGCGGEIMRFNPAPVTSKVPAPGAVHNVGWRLQVEQLERLGDYDSACRVLRQRYLEKSEAAVVDHFSLLLSYLSGKELADWWQRESDKDLLCRIGSEYFFRLRQRPESSLSPVESTILLDLARFLSSGCEISEDVRADAKALMFAHQLRAAATEIKIGCLLPLSGPNASAGERFLRGMEVALEVYPQPVPVTKPAAEDVSQPGKLSNPEDVKNDGTGVTDSGSVSPVHQRSFDDVTESESAKIFSGRGLAASSATAALPHLRLFLYDTAGEGEQARAGVSYLVNEKKVDLIIGPYTGKAANYAAAQAQSMGVTMISLSPLLRNLERYPNVFQHCPTIRNQAASLAKLARIRLGLEKFALLVPKNRYGREFAEDFTSQIQSWGGQVVRQVEYDASRPDFGASIKELIGVRRYRRFKEKRKDYEVWLKQRQRREKQLQAPAGVKLELDDEEKLANLAREIGIDGAELNIMDEDEVMPRPLLNCDFDALVVPDREQTLKLLIPQLAFYDLDECFLLGGRYWNNAEFLNSVANYAEDSFFIGACLPPVPISSDADAVASSPEAGSQARFQADFTALNQGQVPGLLELYGYDTIMLLRKLAIKLDDPSADAETWRQLLAGCRDLPLASGLTTTLDDGEIAKKLYPLVFRKGKISLVTESCF